MRALQATRAGRRTIKIQGALEHHHTDNGQGAQPWRKTFAVLEGGYVHFFDDVRPVPVQPLLQPGPSPPCAPRPASDHHLVMDTDVAAEGRLEGTGPR